MQNASTSVLTNAYTASKCQYQEIRQGIVVFDTVAQLLYFVKQRDEWALTHKYNKPAIKGSVPSTDIFLAWHKYPIRLERNLLYYWLLRLQMYCRVQLNSVLFRSA